MLGLCLLRRMPTDSSSFSSRDLRGVHKYHRCLATGCRLPCPPGSRLQDPMVHRKPLPTQTTPSSTCPSDPKMRGAPGPSARPERTRGSMVSGQRWSCYALDQQLGQQLGHQALKAGARSGRTPGLGQLCCLGPRYGTQPSPALALSFLGRMHQAEYSGLSLWTVLPPLPCDQTKYPQTAQHGLQDTSARAQGPPQICQLFLDPVLQTSAPLPWWHPAS